MADKEQTQLVPLTPEELKQASADLRAADTARLDSDRTLPTSGAVAEERARRIKSAPELKRKQTPASVPTPRQRDEQDAVESDRATFADCFEWTESDYEAVDAATDSQKWEQPGWEEDPALRRIRKQVGYDREDESKPVLQHSEAPTKAALELLSFNKLPDGSILAPNSYTKTALLNTYNSFSETLSQIRVVVQARPTISPQELRTTFADTTLGGAASDADWQEWIEVFGPRENARAKNITLVLLHKRTGLKISSLKTKLSYARGQN